MFYQLPPVGNPIYLSNAGQLADFSQIFGDQYHPYYYASGTAALSAALIAAIKYKAIDEPEVLLPAYGCPDLISATVFAGAKPVLVDFEADSTWMDLTQLSKKISDKTVAVVAVDLFGISERFDKLRLITEKAGLVLIQDSAQAFPNSKEKGIWHGDLVVLSFGRGKPVSLLGGGAVLSRERKFDEILPIGAKRSCGVLSRLLFRLKVLLYNLMIHPRIYWLPLSLPFFHLGETRYHALDLIEDMGQSQLPLLPVNVKAYRDSPVNIQNRIAEMLGEVQQGQCRISDLPKACNHPENRRLLRYPILVEPEDRQRLYRDMNRSGLGASLMYPAILPEIPGIEKLLSEQGDYPVAREFAERLLTLPTHQHVKLADIDKMHQVLSC